MGLFSGIKNNWRKAEAAVVIQNLFENMNFIFPDNEKPDQAAKKIIELGWNSMPDVFGGKFGQYPHKFTTAAYSLAAVLKAQQNESDLTSVMIIALTNILSELQTNGAFYPLNSTDMKLLDVAASVVEEISDEMDGQFGNLAGDLGS